MGQGRRLPSLPLPEFTTEEKNKNRKI